MVNKTLREALEVNHIKYWELADAVGISSSLLSVWLRHELTGTRLHRVTTALDLLTRAQYMARKEEEK